MLSSLKHRGPDNTGEYHGKSGKKKIFLGHQRLSIIDLSKEGNQPMMTADEKVVIVYNGEIYNFQDLKSEFLQEYRFRSNSDTEVILYMYEKFGIDFIGYLEGDFAIALLDRTRSLFFLIRDRMGVKPLYYYYGNNQNDLIFGSELKAITSSGINAAINQAVIQQFFVFKYVPGNNTLVSEIKRVPPGSYMKYDLKDGKLEQKFYWVLEKRTEYQRMSYSDAKAVLRSLLEKAVKSRLISDVPVGTFLSGGLDSSIIASIVQDRYDIRHYCARKSIADLKAEGTTSDGFYAQKYASEKGLNLDFLDIGGDEADRDLIRKTIFYSDDLIADGSQIPSYLITQKASESSKVILSGMGADELFLGYAGHQLTLMSLLLEKFPVFLNRFISSMLSGINQGRGHFLAYRRYLHRIGKYQNYPDYKFGFLNIVGDFENSLSVYEGDREQQTAFFNHYFSGSDNRFDSLFRFEMENFLVKNLHYLDRMSMANSVESRVPYLDHGIVEFAYSIPRTYKLSNSGKAKKILKDSFRKDIPGNILNRRKAGFGMPLRSIFKKESNVDKLLEKDFFSSFHGFSIDSINKVISNHISGKEDNSSIIYALVSFQEWYKMNF